jgi:Icc-related predicted phosphoesterase
MRFFFASDVHGSTTCFRKLVNSGAFYGADVLVMGGDLTGKELVPLVARGSGWSASFRGAAAELATEAEASEFERIVATLGGYTKRVESDEVAAWAANQELVEENLHQLARERTEEWVGFAADRLEGSGRRLLIGLGNDDFDDLGPLLDHGPVAYAHDGPLDLGDVTLASVGYSNPTPWDTQRELTEEQMASVLAGIAETSDPSRTLLNIHVPPFNSGLDFAPRLNAELQIQLSGGEPDMIPVGSTGVAEGIAAFQPLVSLHGHIHEGRGMTRIGRTTVINPGSEYQQASLLGAVFDVAKGKAKHFQLVSG